MELSKQSLIHKFGRILPTVLGALGGYAYYFWIGCVSGTCPITSNPWISTGYGALLGFLISPGLQEFLKKKKEKE
jgi:cell division protein FtsW (lipid II flippase)